MTMINSFTSLLVILPLVALAGEKNCTVAPAQRDGHSSVSRPESASHVVSVTASLRDSSRIKGILLTRHLRGSTLFRNDLTLSPKCISEITFADANGPATVRLSNGDILTVTLATPTVTIKSPALGKIHVPCTSLSSLSVDSIGEPDANRDLVYSCDFETTASIPGYKAGSLVPGKSGMALHVPDHTSAAKLDLPPGSIGPKGTIEFWGKIDEGARMTEDGCPRFFEIIDMVTKREISQDWNSNNGSGGYGLTFRIHGVPVMVSSDYGKYSYASILGDMTGWHHYALVWDADGLDVSGPPPVRRSASGKTYRLPEAGSGESARPKAAVLVDGRCIMTSYSDTWDGLSFSTLTTTLFFPCREDEMPRYGRVGYTIDSFRIWKSPKLKFDLQ